MIWYFLTIVLDVFPFIFLQYLPFTSKLKHGYLNTIMICLCVLMFWFIPFPFLMMQPWFTSTWMLIYRISILIPLFVLTVYFLRHNLFQNLFVFFLMLPYVLLILITVSLFKNSIVSSDFPPYIYSCFGRIIVTAITFPLALWAVHKFLNPAINLHDGGIWKYAWAIPASHNLVSIFFIRDDYEFHGANILQFLGAVSIIASCILTCLMMVVVLKRTQERAELLERERYSTLLLELQAQQYSAVAKSIDETTRSRHDMRHHLLLIKAFIISGDLEGLHTYISEYESGLSLQTSLTTFSKNHAVNVILGHYVTMAELEDIQVEVDLANIEYAHISDTDLCVLLGNLMENAIEACRTITEKKQIQLKSTYLAGRFAIVITNNFNGVVEKKNGHFLSRKRNYAEEGIGLATVDTIIHKYGGQLRMQQEGQRFEVSLFVITKQIESDVS